MITYHQSGGAKQWLMVKRIVGLCMFLIASVSSASEVRIIANPSVTSSSIRKADAAKIFLGKTTFWDNGDKIIPVILRSGEVHENFLKQYIEKTPSQFTMYWKQIVFSGKGLELKSFDSESDLVKFVSETGGAVGYAENPPHGSVKILVVE